MYIYENGASRLTESYPGAGNSPPWTLRAKARYGAIEGPRATAQAGRTDIRFPKELMPMAHTILPLRALHYIKSHHPREKYHAALEHLFHKFWTPPNLNLSQADVLAGVLADYKGFSPEECKMILEGARSQEMKDALTRSTQSALDKGAFGAPWLWVRNDKGVAEPFFGSDRYASRERGCHWRSSSLTLFPGSIMCISSSACHTRISSFCRPGGGLNCETIA